MTSVCCFFLALPAELRIHIYKLLLIGAQPSTIYTNPLPHVLGNDLHPAVLGTCKSIHAEAEDMLYNFNTFRIDLRHISLRHPWKQPTAVASYLPLFIQYIPEVCERGEHLPRSNIKVVQRGVLTHQTLRKMKHLEIVTDHHINQLPFIMTNPFSEKGQLLLEILRIIGDSEVAEGDRYLASLRIRIEHRESSRTRVRKPPEELSKVLKVLQKSLQEGNSMLN